VRRLSPCHGEPDTDFGSRDAPGTETLLTCPIPNKMGLVADFALRVAALILAYACFVFFNRLDKTICEK
jgi:hypothetical protein